MKYLLFLWLGFIGLVHAADDKRERLYAELVEKTLRMGEPVWLKTAEKPFLSIYTQTEQKKTVGTAIILHDQGGFADQKPLIHQFRTELPQHRWTTLSLQLPVLEEGAETEDYFALEAQTMARINAAITFLKKSNSEKIVLLGYGLGASFALSYAEKKPQTVKAVVLISLKLPAANDHRKNCHPA